MMFDYERRYLDRFEIPNAKIEYRLLSGRSAKVKLIDITKISAQFFTQHKMTEGEYIDLDILVEGIEKIVVKGHIVRTIGSEIKNKAIAVVQFLPFGTDDRINNMKCYEQLAQLTEKFFKEDKILKNIYKS